MRLGFAASPGWCSMSSASRWLQSRYRGRRRASRANGSPISARSCDERPMKSRRSSAARCPSGANSGRQAAKRVPLAPSGYAYFHNAENVVESLWRALCSGILTLAVSRRVKKGRLRRGMEAEAQVARRFAPEAPQGELALQLREAHVITVRRDSRRNQNDGQTVGAPGRYSASQRKKELLSLEEPRRVE